MYTTLYKISERLMPAWLHERLIGRWGAHGLKRYTSNTLWALIVRIFNSVTSFLVTIYLVRHLGPTNYGELSYALSFVSLFGIIATLGIDNVLYRDLVKYPDRKNEYLGTAFTIRVVAGTIAGLTAAAFGLYANPDDVSRLVIILLSCTFVFTSFNIITNEFQANVAQKYPSFVTLFVVIILNLLKLGVIIAGEGVLYIAAILLLEPVLYAIFFSYIRIKHYGSFSAWRFDRGVAKSLLIDSWPFIFIAVFMALYSRIDQIMLKHLVDSAAVGIYDAALRLAEAWLFIPAIIASSLFPAIVNGKKAGTGEYRARLLLMVGVFLSLAIAVALPLSLLSKPLIALLYGAEFSGSAAVFSIYVWVGVWAVIDIVTRQYLIVENMRKTIFFLSAGTALLNTGLNFLLIPALGPAGAAWSTFISYAMMSIPLIFIYRLK